MTPYKDRRKIRFQRVQCASGTRGFFGEGYSFHKLTRPDFRGTTLVGKTMTLRLRLDPSKKQGNMPLKADGITPAEFYPRCIVARPWTGAAVNAVGLSNPGAERIWATGRYQALAEPFIVSVMGLGDTLEERMREMRDLVDILAGKIDACKSPFGVEYNIWCPNVRHADDAVGETLRALDMLGELDLPVFVKIACTISVDKAATIAQHPAVTGIVCSNTVAWDDLRTLGIELWQYFGTDVSPLAHLGGGGVSGEPIRELVLTWLDDARRFGFPKPITGCGGIRCADHARDHIRAGVSAVQIGSMTFTAPHRVASTIAGAFECFSSYYRNGGAL